MEGKIVYFKTPGKANTDLTLKVARQRIEELGVKQIVLASSHGYTAKKAKAMFVGLDVEIIAVTICAAFHKEGWTMTSQERQELESMGIKVLTSLHALGDDVSATFDAKSPNQIVRETLYRFCQGMKVAVEITLMSADAGLINISKEIIAIAGSDEGADTALVLKPAYSGNFTDLKIKEILAKPR